MPQQQQVARTRPRGRNMKPAERAYAQRRILHIFASCGSLRRAAAIAGVSRSTAYRWLDTDDDFAARFAAAERDWLQLPPDTGAGSMRDR